MEEENLSDDIYGDLDNFEFNEKLKEHGEEIASLKERLNQSAATIADLQEGIKNLEKVNRELNKNISSLYLTAKLEIGRKDRNIGALQQKIDNRIFRRPNNSSTAVQTDHCNNNTSNINNNENIPENPQQPHPMEVDRCNQNDSDNFSKTNDSNNDISKYRIPKKNPFARHVNSDVHRDPLNACNGKESESSHDPPSHHLPNPQPRCQNERPNGSHVSRSDRRDIDGDRITSKDRIAEVKDSRRHSPALHVSSRHQDHRKLNSNADDQRRDSRRNDRKHLRSRSPNNETDRHSTRYRSKSTSKRHRSRSRPTRNEETRPRTRSPKRRRSRSKPARDDRIEDEQNSISELQENELQAMLIAQKKILDEMDSRQRVGRNKLSPEDSSKRNISNSGNVPAKKSKHHGKSEDLNSANKANIAKINESRNTEKVLTTDAVVNCTNANGFVESLELQPVATSNLSTKLPLIESSSCENVTKPFSPLGELLKSVEKPLKSTVTKVDVPEAALPTKKSISPLKNVSSPVEKLSEPIIAKVDTVEAAVPPNVTKPPLKQLTESVEKQLKSTISKVDTVEIAVPTDDRKPFSSLKQFTESFEKPLDSAPAKVDTVEVAVPTGDQKPFSPLKKLTKSFEKSLESTPAKVDTVKVAVPTDDPKPFSQLEEFFSTVEKPPKPIVTNTVDVCKTNGFQNSENSNSQMDIDYELMERTTTENVTNFPCEKMDNRKLAENSPTVNGGTAEAASPTRITASIVAMEDAVPANESSLNSSSERHILSKSSEYTVQDVGHEIRIFLTKKRKKSKNAKVTT